MALKDDIESIKNDLVGESRFLEEYIKIENHFKKHKKKIFSIVGLAVAFLIGVSVYDYIQESKKEKANEAYLKYASNPLDKAALETVKSNNKKMYDLLALKEAIKKRDKEALIGLSSNDSEIISEIAKYHIASLSEKTDSLEEYVINEKAFLKDFASLQLAYRQYLEKEFKKAKGTLAGIPYDSPLKKSATILEHYGILNK